MTLWQPGDLPEGTTLSLAINQTFMQVGVYPSVTLKRQVDMEDKGNVSKSPLMGWKARINVYTLFIKPLLGFISTRIYLPSQTGQHLVSKCQYLLLSLTDFIKQYSKDHGEKGKIFTVSLYGGLLHVKMLWFVHLFTESRYQSLTPVPL